HTVQRAVNVRFYSPLDIMGNEQIEVAIFVVVQPSRASAIVSTAQACLLSHVCKLSITQISEQPVASQPTDKNIYPAVVVVVANSDSHTVHLDRQASFTGSIREGAVPVVAVEGRERSSTLVAWPVHAVDEQNILPTVVVVI